MNVFYECIYSEKDDIFKFIQGFYRAFMKDFEIEKYVKYSIKWVIMVIVSYDIADDKKRRRFSKFLEQFGYRIQYSVFEINNSDSIIDNIILKIETEFSKIFNQEDSIMILKLSKTCKVIKYGYASNNDKDLIFI